MRRRREDGWDRSPEMARRGDPWGSVNNLFTQDSDWISYHTVVSTPDDQIAIAPGYLQRDWQQNDNADYSYDMGEIKIQSFYAYVSGRYDVKRAVQGSEHRDLPRAAAQLRCGPHAGSGGGRTPTTTRPITVRSSSSSSGYWSFRATGGLRNPFPTPVPSRKTFWIWRVLDPKKDIDFYLFRHRT